MKKKTFNLPLTAFLLALSFVLPGFAFALRTEAGLESKAQAGLEASLREDSSVPTAGLEESPVVIAKALGVTVEELGPIAEVLELTPEQFLRLARIIQLPIPPGMPLPFFRRGGFLLHRPTLRGMGVERYYVRSFTDYDGGSGYAWVLVERLNPTSQDEQINRDIQINGDEPDAYVYIPPISAGMEEMGERIVVMNKLSSALGSAMMRTWHKEERPPIFADRSHTHRARFGSSGTDGSYRTFVRGLLLPDSRIENPPCYVVPC